MMITELDARKNPTTLSEITTGDVFWSPAHGGLFMKTSQSTQQNNMDYVVSLENGRLSNLERDSIVNLCEATIVFKKY